ncbi:MAG TPA: TIR domain-containing protein [Verrucomicrobiota bacterium]|nr:hypothetical protein [Verrucomicrobiales bacterium]HRI13679.1 TIR domain-containing protein [Verrucomicrobiota bacterium]
MAKRVYFVFHYQDVIDFRANVVRNHSLTKGLEKAGYYDASIWEESKKKGELALKRMINAELEYTSVTVVLVGTHTYARRWVRYEIMKSAERGNVMLGVQINSIPGKDRLTKLPGPNPFQYLGVTISADGKRATPHEWDGTKWKLYSDLGAFTLLEQPVANRGKFFPLTQWFPVNDWVQHNGFNNFNTWLG